jgi:two-component system CheB/CheR fusion protein
MSGASLRSTQRVIVRWFTGRDDFEFAVKRSQVYANGIFLMNLRSTGTLQANRGRVLSLTEINTSIGRALPRGHVIGRHWQTPHAVLRSHAAIVEFAYDAFIGATGDGIVRSWNHAAARLFGYKAMEIIGKHVSILSGAEQAQEHNGLIASARAGVLAAPIETACRRRDGTSVAVEFNAVPIRSISGEIVALAVTARDISARKLADAHRTLVTEELAHRVKNTLATVQSIAALCLRGAASLEAFSIVFAARIQALSTTHMLLTQNGWKSADLGELVKAELAPYIQAGAAPPDIAGPRVELDPSRALAFGMVLHELATNAAKYGAFSVPEGRVDVSWETRAAEGGPRLRLMWCESGGPAAVQPARQGLGTRLVTRELAQELGGAVTLAFPRAGVSCMIDIPLRPASTT